MGALVTLESARACLRTRERLHSALAAGRDRADPSGASAAARDWLETQARVVEYWRDLLAETGAAGDLVEALDAHAAFLNGMVARV